jgi:hypothetical protein
MVRLALKADSEPANPLLTADVMIQYGPELLVGVRVAVGCVGAARSGKEGGSALGGESGRNRKFVWEIAEASPEYTLSTDAEPHAVIAS